MNEKFNQQINEFIKSVNLKWCKDLKIRYIYRGLSSFFQRDLDYFLACSREQVRQYREGFLMKGKNVVCQSICKYYQRVLKRLHIESKIIITNEKTVPHYALIVNGDRGWYFLDL